MGFSAAVRLQATSLPRLVDKTAQTGRYTWLPVKSLEKYGDCWIAPIKWGLSGVIPNAVSDHGDTMQQLVARLTRGETAAFAELYDCCGNQLHHYLVRRLGSREAADEVLQETFVRLAKSHKRFASVENPIAYAFTVARNEALRMGQNQGRRRALLSAVDLFEIAGRDERQSREAIEAVTLALSRIPEEQREVVELRIYSGLTFREIADVTGEPQGTVATRYRAAISRLRNILAKEWS